MTLKHKLLRTIMTAIIHKQDTACRVKSVEIKSPEHFVNSFKGSFTFLSVLEVWYQIFGANIKITLKLLDVEIGNVTLNSHNPLATISGNVDNIEAKVTFLFKLSPLALDIRGSVKYVVGFKSQLFTFWTNETLVRYHYKVTDVN